MVEIVCPGKRLGRVGEFRAGPGTYVRGSYIYASVVGPKVEQAGADEDKPFLIVSAHWADVTYHMIGCRSPNERERFGRALVVHFARRCWVCFGECATGLPPEALWLYGTRVSACHVDGQAAA